MHYVRVAERVKAFPQEDDEWLERDLGSDAARVFPSAALLAPTEAPLSAGSRNRGKGANQWHSAF